MPDPLDAISPKSTHPRQFTRDFTDSEDEVEGLPVTSTLLPSSIEARDHTSRDFTSPDPSEQSRHDDTSELGSKKPVIQLPRPTTGHHPPRKKSQMDWLHGRHPSQLHEGPSSNKVGAGVAAAEPKAKVGGAGPATIGTGVGSASSLGSGSGTTTLQPSSPPLISATTPLARPRTSISGWTPNEGDGASSPLRGDDEVAEDDLKPIPAPFDPEEMPSAAVVAAAAGRSIKIKRSKQKASVKPTPVERFYGTSHRDRDPFGSDDDEAPAPVRGRGADTEEGESKVQTTTTDRIPVPSYLSKAEREFKDAKEEVLSEGVGSSMGGDGEAKKKKRTNKKKGEAGPGKAWRKGLKDVDRLAGRTPGTYSASSSVEPQIAPSSLSAGPSASKKRKLPELIALPMLAGERPKISRKGSSMMRGSEREGSDPDDELAELLEGGPLNNRRRPSIDSSNDEGDKPQMAFKPPRPPVPVRPETTGLTKAQLRSPADLESLGHPIYSRHIPGKALPVYRIPSPVRNKEKELAVPLPLRDQVGPGPRGWQVGTRIVLGVGGAHLRLKSWMSTGTSLFSEHKRAVAEQARLAHAQAMYQQQQLQLNGSQQPGYEQQQSYAGISGWQGPPIPAGSSPYPDPSYGLSYPQGIPGTQPFANPLSPLPLHSGQMSPVQLPFMPPGGDRAIYTAMPPLAGAKPKGKKRAAPGEGRPTKAKKVKKLFGPMGDLMTSMPSGPTTPMPLPLAGSSPILPPASITGVSQPGRAGSPVQLPLPSVLQHHITPPDGFTSDGAAPPPKLKVKKPRVSAAGKRVAADALLGSDDNDVEILEAVHMAKQESGDSLDKEMEDLL